MSEIPDISAVIWRLKQRGQRFLLSSSAVVSFKILSCSSGCGSLNFKTEHNKFHLAWLLDLVKTSSCINGRSHEGPLVPVSIAVSLLHPCSYFYMAAFGGL